MAGRLMAPSPGGINWTGGLLCEPGFGHGLGVYGGHLASPLDWNKPRWGGVQLFQAAGKRSKHEETAEKTPDQPRSHRASAEADRDRIPTSKLVVDRNNKCRRENSLDARWLGARVNVQEVKTTTEADAVRARVAVRDTAVEWKKLSHANILQVWGYCDEDTPAFVHNRTLGLTLSEYVREQPEMLWPKLRELIIAALFLKKRGLVIDIVTPEDVLIGLDKRVKVAGFHRILARRLDPEVSRMCDADRASRPSVKRVARKLSQFAAGKCGVGSLTLQDEAERPSDSTALQAVEVSVDCHPVGEAADPLDDWSTPMDELFFESKTSKQLAVEAEDPLNDWRIARDENSFDRNDLLGSGSFGSAYRGRWMDAEVGIKQFHINSELGDRFGWEADSWFRLNYPRSLKMFGAACDRKTHFFVNELAAEGSEFWNKIYEASLGLRSLHERDVAHGDLMCNNTIVTSDRRSKLTDFGLSAVTRQDQAPTPVIRWVAPEQLAKPSTPLTFVSDVYSLAMCIVEVATGSNPFWSEATDSSTATRPRLQRSSMFTDDQWALVERMCREDPQQRLSVGAVVQALAKLANDTGYEGAKPDGDAERSRAAAAMSRLRRRLVSHQGLEDRDSIRGCLLQIAGTLWSRMEDVIGRVQALAPAAVQAFRELVESACEAIQKLVDDDMDSADAFPAAATRMFALHQRLDNLMDANRLRAEEGGGECHDWRAACLAVWQRQSETKRSKD